MKFDWKYEYVPEGQLEPDKHGRWAISCYIYVHIDKALPQYDWCKDLYGGRQHMPVRVATMTKKGTKNGVVPSLINEFCVCMPSFWEAGNLGMSNSHFFYANDIDELKIL
jgi:hypothetical protein